AVAVVEPGRSSRWWWLLSAVCCGLGVLTKGPVAVVLVAPPLIAHSWLKRLDLRRQLGPWLMFGAIVAAINLPWYLAIAQKAPEFSGSFFWEHNVARFLSGSNHPNPGWYYLPVLLLGWMPWGLLLFPLIQFLASRDERCREQRPASIGLLAIAAVWCLAFFSVSRGKLPTYIVPCFPAIALLLGHYLQCTHSPFTYGISLAPVQKLFRQGAVWVALAGMVFPVVMWKLEIETGKVAVFHSLLWCVVMCGFVLWGRKLSPRMTYAAFCVVALVVTLEGSHHLFPAWAVRRSVITPDSQLLTEMGDHRYAVACLQQSPGSVPFYLNREDVVLLRCEEPERIVDYVAHSDHGFLIVDESVPDDRLQRSIPRTHALEQLSSGRNGRIFRIHAVASHAHDVSADSGIIRVQARVQSDAPSEVVTQ
ncbi:MAG: phospholipid carrier-dependent glycosyltransferase, partial [Planctomycetaceae bacterium]|nr:phospholipid carrier-dependent glycosyltransferase [Planctomycetaceae bacterium]